MQFLRQLVDNWASWLGDRDLEIALRKHLNEQGFFGDSAKFRQLRLMAVQRPGWLQVYTFTVEAMSQLNTSEQPQCLFGIVRQDERYNRLEISVFSNRSERSKLLDEWSEDLIRLQGRSTLS